MSILSEAVAFAGDRHAGQLRKAAVVDSPVLYVSHLLAVASLVLEYGGDLDCAAAAVLHDVVEDTDTTLVELSDVFSPRIAAIVGACSDTLPGDTPEAKSPWKARKDAYIAHLGSAGDAVCLVAACDKVHNLASFLEAARLARSIALEGFKATPEETRWFYTSVLDAVSGRIPVALADRYRRLLADLDELIAAS